MTALCDSLRLLVNTAELRENIKAMTAKMWDGPDEAAL